MMIMMSGSVCCEQTVCQRLAAAVAPAVAAVRLVSAGQQPRHGHVHVRDDSSRFQLLHTSKGSRPQPQRNEALLSQSSA
jgi:hypothetical protein